MDERAKRLKEFRERVLKAREDLRGGKDKDPGDGKKHETETSSIDWKISYKTLKGPPK